MSQHLLLQPEPASRVHQRSKMAFRAAALAFIRRVDGSLGAEANARSALLSLRSSRAAGALWIPMPRRPRAAELIRPPRVPQPRRW